MATILVVDDEPDIRFFVQINLELDGHTVVTANDGAQALEAVRAARPDVILLDVMMPKVDGWAVLETLKAELDDSIKTIPVLMLTARSTDDDVVRGGIEGAVRYLIKPVTPEQLRQAVDDALAAPEPEQRRRAQHGALEKLARMEKGGSSAPSTAPRPRITNLQKPSLVQGPEEPVAAAIGDLGSLDMLTSKQRALLDALRSAPTVSAAAEDLGVSRSNVYASLRRIGRRLDIESVPILLRRLRATDLPE
jgi:CheY-like chemotaxis protein